MITTKGVSLEQPEVGTEWQKKTTRTTALVFRASPCFGRSGPQVAQETQDLRSQCLTRDFQCLTVRSTIIGVAVVQGEPPGGPLIAPLAGKRDRDTIFLPWCFEKAVTEQGEKGTGTEATAPGRYTEYKYVPTCPPQHNGDQVAVEALTSRFFQRGSQIGSAWNDACKGRDRDG